ncbi:MAG: glycine--tRNA ligase subunit beta [Clostridia bacterium]|nr:glycine--tRNA ligase subunit beta [Clostridia bacterium]
MSSFLLEIGVEELPARFIDPALQQLEEMSRKMLTELRIAFGQIKAYGTPRRLALLIEGLSDEQQSLTKEVKGPAVKVAYDADGNLTKAALGFAKSQKIAAQDLIRKDLNGVDYVFAVIRQEGRPVKEVLPQFCLDLITGLHFPKPMRWGDLAIRFARPIRWLVGLYNQEIIPFNFANLDSGRITYGHRFLAKEPLTLNQPEDYLETLHKAYVMADTAQRKALIWQQVCQAAQEAGGQAEENAELLDEVNNLLEWPTAFVGSFDAEFLRLPKEALVTPMREHQRYFPVVGADGRLLNKFVGVKNGTPEHLDIVRAGNEKVLRARLYDAAFFWDEDLKTPLIDRIDELKKIVWQESLGSIYGKVERIAALTQWLGSKLAASAEEQKTADRSALLCKADLVTSMVYEFTELQGVMGREYAVQNGEGQAVAQAIFEHYLPRFAGDELPASLPGQILALADKMDSLVGCFGIGILPTGSQDPYALRRQALGIANIILNGGLVLSLEELISVAYDAYNDPQYPLTKSKEEVTS